MTLQAKDYDLRQTLVPFVASVLHYGTLREHKSRGEVIPVGHPEIYYNDEVEALRQIFSQGVLWRLCQTCDGWDTRALLEGSEAWSSKSTHQRFWEINSGLTLRFGEASVMFCEELYNVVARRGVRVKEGSAKRRPESVALRRLKSLEFEATGEQQLVYWMLDGLWPDLDPDSPDARYRGRSHWGAWLDHFVATQPMLQLKYGPWREAVNVDKSQIASLVNGPLRQTLPWWLRDALSRWQVLEPYIWQSQSPERHVELREAQRTIWDGWFEVIEASEWYHLLVPFLDHLRGCYLGLVRDCSAPGYALTVSPTEPPRSDVEVSEDEIVERAIALVNSVYHDRRHEERQRVRDGWARYLGVGAALEALYEKVRRIHPADRDEQHVWLINWWAREENGLLLDKLRRISRGIEGRLG